jgi:hypothetical protein
MERLLYWISERESIRLKKKAGEPKPWTDDEILQHYRFCNVRRMDDKVSQWLLKNWYEPFFNHPNILTACVLARQLNNPDSLEEVGFPEKWNPSRVRRILERRAAAGLRNLSAAYIITGKMGGTKIVQIVEKVVDMVHRAKVKIDPCSMETTWSRLVGLPGIQSFMAGQIIADLRWAVTGSWADRMSWAPLGPGSQRGLNRLEGHPLKTRWCQDAFLPSLRWLIALIQTEIPKSISSRLEVQDIQSCLCEYDKYCRALLGEGRPKQRYEGYAT